MFQFLGQFFGWFQDQHAIVRVPLFLIIGYQLFRLALVIIVVPVQLGWRLWLRYGRSPRAVSLLIRKELPYLHLEAIGTATHVDSLITKVQRALLRYLRGRSVDDTWAELQYGAGALYALRRSGDLASNQEQAIHHYEQALERYAGSAGSEGWILTNNDLGYLYRNRIRGDQADNGEAAIHYGRIALEARTRRVFPTTWCVNPDSPGDVLRRRPPGEHADVNALVRDLLEDRRENPDGISQVDDLMEGLNGWARSQNNMGAAFYDRIRGDRAENLELAIHHYNQALEVVTPTHGWRDWADAQSNLGAAYTHRIRGSRADNLELGISHLQDALRALSDPMWPEESALVHNNLGAAYLERIRGDRAENLEKSLQHLKQALEVYEFEPYPERWAALQNALGTAYTDRIRGDREENIEKAIRYLEGALEVFGRNSHPEDWAMVHGNLSSAYASREKGNPAENLELAIEHCQEALQVYSADSFPQEWATAQNNLGGFYALRVRGDRVENATQAITHLQEAMRVHTAESFPEAWANIQSNLGGSYGHLLSLDGDDALQMAIHHYHQALKIYSQDAFPKDWARVHNNLAMDYYGAMLLSGKDFVREVVDHFRQSLVVRTPRRYPQECRDTAYSLGRVLFDNNRYSEARVALVTAHEAVEAMRGELVREKSRRAVSEENVDLYARLVNCCLVEGDEDAALQYAVAGKGRSFVDTLASARIDLTAAGADDPQLARDLRDAQALRMQIDSILSQIVDDQGPPQGGGGGGPERSIDALLSNKLLELRMQYAEHWEVMSHKYPALSATQAAPAVSASDARELAAHLGATLVEYFRHAGGWSAFVVTGSRIMHVPLPLMDDHLLERMRAWVRRVSDKESSAGRNELSYGALHRLHEAVIAPLDTCLARGQVVVMAPFGDLHLVPLMAARNPYSRRYVWEDYNLSFAPSIAALRVSLDQERTQTDRMTQGPAERVLSVAYPGTRGSKTYLPGVLEEAEVIEGYFASVISLREEEATPDAALKQARGQDIVHFGCHGLFNPDTPTESGLMLFGGWLTVQRIITELHLDGARLATVAACESGQMALSRGEEHIGLLQALMTAGARTVVSSLWSVDDEATRVLFGAFYAGLREGFAPALALVAAADHVRRHPGWEHPYYWAAFQASGLPFDMTGSVTRAFHTGSETRGQNIVEVQ